MPRKLRLVLRHHRLLLQGLLLVARIRLGLSLHGHEAVRARFCRAAKRPRGGGGVVSTVWAVRNAARLVPGASCLTQALAAQSLLLLHGFDSTVRIGVRRGLRGEFQAHAWLLQNGRIVLGAASEPGPDFVPLTDLAPVRA